MKLIWLAGLAVLGLLLVRRYPAVILEAREVASTTDRVTRPVRERTHTRLMDD